MLFTHYKCTNRIEEIISTLKKMTDFTFNYPLLIDVTKICLNFCNSHSADRVTTHVGLKGQLISPH